MTPLARATQVIEEALGRYDEPNETPEEIARAVLEAIREPILEVCSRHDGRGEQSEFAGGMQAASDAIERTLDQLLSSLDSDTGEPDRSPERQETREN